MQLKLQHNMPLNFTQKLRLLLNFSLKFVFKIQIKEYSSNKRIANIDNFQTKPNPKYKYFSSYICLSIYSDWIIY